MLTLYSTKVDGWVISVVRLRGVARVRLDNVRNEDGSMNRDGHVNYPYQDEEGQVHYRSFVPDSVQEECDSVFERFKDQIDRPITIWEPLGK